MKRNKVRIHGHSIELTDISQQGGIITDVMIIARVVYPEHNADALLIDATENTTGVIQEGIIHAADKITNARWGQIE